ncbi:MAG: trigger factor [Planctomycetota bacterium]|nr:trigger factor [Planctomycetota bacterium]
MAIPAPTVQHDDAPAIEVETRVEDDGVWAKKLAITVPPSEVDKAYDGVVGELAQNLRIPGFRPGKVPRAYAEKRFKDDIEKQVKANLVESAFRAALAKEKLDIVGMPDMDAGQIEVSRGKELSLQMRVEVRPSFELGNYKGLKVEQAEVEIFEEEVQDELDQLAGRFAEQGEAPEGAGVENRDVVAGPLRWLVDGQEVHKEDDGRLMAMDGHVLGAHAHLHDDWLLGAKVGEKRTKEGAELAATFPVEALRGKPAAIEVEVKGIQRPKLPPFDDELAKKVGMKDLEALKNAIKEELRDGLAARVRQEARDQLVGQVVEATAFELPKRLVETYAESLTHRSNQMLAQMGMDPAILEGRKKDLDERARKNAETELRRFFVLDALSTKEGLEIADEDVDEEIVRLARARRMRASELYEQLEQEGGLEQLKQDMKSKKAMDFLEEQAEVKVVPRKKPEAGEHVHGPGCGHDHEPGHVHGPDCGHEHPAEDGKPAGEGA